MATYDVVIVGGAGHVGLPLGLLFANAGINVALWDLNTEALANIQAGVMPFMEDGGEEMLSRLMGKTLHVANGLEVIAECDTVVVTIGTPLDEYQNPTLLPVLQLMEEMRGVLHQGQHVMFRSTLFPGTMDRLVKQLEVDGLEIDLTFCPERILQGKALKEYKSLAQIVSGNNELAISRARALFDKLGVASVIVSLKEAELAKLFSNSWRYIQFAIANQFYSIAEKHDLDFFKLHHAITHGYERAKDMPMPGFAAGPCLFKDTMQLAAFCGDQFGLGQEAARVNEGMPGVLVKSLQKRFDLQHKTIGILGMAFKGECDDIRDSLSYKLRKLLVFNGADVLCADVYVQSPEFKDLDEVLARADAIVIGAPHKAYKGLTVPDDVFVLDPWGITGASSGAA